MLLHNFNINVVALTKAQSLRSTPAALRARSRDQALVKVINVAIANILTNSLQRQGNDFLILALDSKSGRVHSPN